jgi:hypothetical protein
VTRDEQESEKIVPDRVVDVRVDVADTHFLLRLELVSDLLVLSLNELVAAHAVDCTMFRRGHQPRTGIARHARFRPLFERGYKGILCEVFGATYVMNEARESGNQLCRLDSPYSVDCAVCFGN